jgi:hypothetical protein
MDPLGEFGAWFDGLPSDCRAALAYSALTLLPDAPPEMQLAGVPEARFSAWLRAPLAGNLKLIGRCLTLRAAVDFCFDRGLVRAVFRQEELQAVAGAEPRAANLQVRGRESAIRVTPMVGQFEHATEQEVLSGEAWAEFKERHFSDTLLDAFYNCDATVGVASRLS